GPSNPPHHHSLDLRSLLGSETTRPLPLPHKESEIQSPGAEIKRGLIQQYNTNTTNSNNNDNSNNNKQSKISTNTACNSNTTNNNNNNNSNNNKQNKKRTDTA
ncbi:unnamed protein product, partial [Bubo scandiacus]